MVSSPMNKATKQVWQTASVARLCVPPCEALAIPRQWVAMKLFFLFPNQINFEESYSRVLIATVKMQSSSGPLLYLLV